MVVVPASMAQSNRRTLIRALQHLRTASRAELAKNLGMSQPTVGKIVEGLLELGLLEEIGEARDPRRRELAPHGRKGESRMGRPGRILRLEGTRRPLAGIELGVSTTRVALLALGGMERDPGGLEWPTEESVEDWLESMRTVVRQLGTRGLRGVVVSVPGIVDEEGGRVLFSPNLHWIEGQDLPGLLQAIWRVPVVLVQEERALALGHQLAEGGQEDFLLVDFGDGVGGAVVMSGRLYKSPLPLSGELGHTPVIGNRRRCGCGAVGCVESLVSRGGLLRSFTEARGGRKATWRDLVRAVEEGGVPRWLEETLEAMATVIAGALNVLGLRRVVLMGSLTELPAMVCAHLSEAVVRGAMWARFGSVSCEAAPRCRAAGFVAVGLDRLFLPENSVEAGDGRGNGNRARRADDGAAAERARKPERLGMETVRKKRL
jgi:predicted NBD/HSP70 family sugar kinase